MKNFINNFEDGFCSIVLIVSTILTCINVFARYMFNSSMPFVEELTCVGLVIISLVGAPVASKRGAHLGLSVFTDFLSPEANKWISFMANILGVIFSALVLYYGFFMVKQEYALKQVSAGMQWPEWLYGMFIPIGGAVMLIRFAQLALKDIRKKGEN